MSGSVLSPWSLQKTPEENAKDLAREVGCFNEDIIDCLRVIFMKQFIVINVKVKDKPASSLVQAVDTLIRGGDASKLFAPSISTSMQSSL